MLTRVFSVLGKSKTGHQERFSNRISNPRSGFSGQSFQIRFRINERASALPWYCPGLDQAASPRSDSALLLVFPLFGPASFFLPPLREFWDGVKRQDRRDPFPLKSTLKDSERPGDVVVYDVDLH